MKAFVIGVKRIAGTSRKSGNEFDMCRVMIGSPIQAVQNDSLTVQGFGYEVNEIPLDVEALAQFRTVRLPAMVDLETDNRPFKGKLEVVVVGVRAAVADKAAA